MHDVTTLDLARIAQDLQIRKVQVESVVLLLDEGNTVPFITRYRKERTGSLNEEVIREVQVRVGLLRQLADRKQTILKTIEGQGKLTDELRAAILGSETSKRLEDLYLPYKPKKKTAASVARERGLEPLAHAIRNADPAVANLDEALAGLVNPEKELVTVEDVRAGVGHILAEEVAETADVRAAVRYVLWDTGKLATAKNESLGEMDGLEYKDYFQFTEPVRQIPPHRILAINRGEKENALKARLEWNADAIQQALFAGLHGRPPVLPLTDHPHAAFLKTVAEDALSRLLLPSLEREVRRELTEHAEHHAVAIFARNLRSLLLQPPLHGKRILAIDPGFRTGCKVAVLDEVGNMLEHGVIYPHVLQSRHQKKGPPAPAPAPPPAPAAAAAPAPDALQETPPPPAEGTPPPPPESKAEPPPPPESKAEPPPPPAGKKADDSRRKEARARMEELVRRHQVNVIVIGNGTACRETEEFVSEFIESLDKRRTHPGQGQPESSASPAPGTPAPAEPQAGPAPAESQAAPSEPAAPPAPEPSAVMEAPQETAPAPAPVPVESPVAEAPAAASAAPLPEPVADLAYVIVNEAGASVYSTSAVGREEFPDYDATLRGTISIGRRMQDPLSELVKIDPQSIGVGLYQHDVNPRHLKESLDGVVESCVNHVGVDLNTASVPLLRHVSGLNQLAAREVVAYRAQNGPFTNREQLMQVPGIGTARFVQAAGFLKITKAANPLDRTWIHPESYPVAQRLLADLGYAPEALEDREKTAELRDKLKGLPPEEVAARLQVGVPTVRDILEALGRPGRDPREDLPQPIFKKGILKLEDLQPGMELKGTVLNVVDFGAFVDIGLKDSGLVHISQMANRYIKSPYDVVSVSDVVTVWVLTVDQGRRRVSLTMIKPGTERRPMEKRERPEQQQQPRPPRGQRPPRGRRPAPVSAAPGGAAPQGGQAAVPGRGHHQTAQPAAAVGSAPARQPPPPPRPLPPRRHQRQPPRPKLSQAALEGEAPLRTFSELLAFFEAKEKEEPRPPQPEPPAEQAPPPA